MKLTRRFLLRGTCQGALAEASLPAGIVMGGAAGIGKTSLLRAVAQWAVEHGRCVLSTTEHCVA